jgi:hypothetical protein
MRLFVGLKNFVIASEQRSDLVNGAVADFVNKYGLDCLIVVIIVGQIIHGYSGDSLADLEMCEFCYTTPNSKFNLRNDLEELLKKATAIAITEWISPDYGSQIFNN